jgi:hypothetical protein
MKILKSNIWLLFVFMVIRNETSAQVSFSEQTIDNSVQIGYGLAIGDVNGDRRPDILLADKKAFVWYRNPDWTRFVMIENLTERDNVCLAARDINGNGRVEVAVGAQWNPGETTDETASGSVHFLVRPPDPTKIWKATPLPHEPTVHRMGWVKTSSGFQLVVVPLHGRGNRDGEGQGVRIYVYQPPSYPLGSWNRILVDSNLHVTHNFDILPDGEYESLLIGGREGARHFRFVNHQWTMETDSIFHTDPYGGFGEIRKVATFGAGIQPFHGNRLTVHLPEQSPKIITEELQQGHALACADLLNQGMEQLIVGWREKNSRGEMGIKIYLAGDRQWNAWTEHWIDNSGMACEDLKIADLDGDGKPEIIAAGRSTRNLKIYWNRN